MNEQSIRALAVALEAEKRLVRIRRKVDPGTEFAAVALKAYAERRQGTLFEDAAGWQSAAQLLADRGQWATALGLPDTEMLTAIETRLKSERAPAIVAAASAPVAAVRRERDAMALETLPMARAGDGDDGPQMAAVAISIDPDSGRDCLGLTRHHCAGPGRLSVIGLCPALERLRQAWHRRGQPMPLALALGGDPALYLAAAIGTWRPADLALAGSLGGATIKVLRDDRDGLPLPAEAELVVVGDLPPGETVAAGWLTNVFAAAADAGAVPVLAAHTMLRRADPLFYGMQVGVGGDLAGTLGLAAEALVAAHIRNIEGGLEFIDIRVPAAAGGRVVVLKLRGRMEGQTKTALMGALSGMANWFKLAIMVDEDVDPSDLRDVFWSVASRTHAERDVGMVDGLRAHPDDGASPADTNGARTGTRWFIDSSMPPLSQAKAREDFARAIPKNLSETDLAQFLPRG